MLWKGGFGDLGGNNCCLSLPTNAEVWKEEDTWSGRGRKLDSRSNLRYSPFKTFIICVLLASHFCGLRKHQKSSAPFPRILKGDSELSFLKK